MHPPHTIPEIQRVADTPPQHTHTTTTHPHAHTHQEIQRFVEDTTGANKQDPFEGMSPEEIDAYVAKHGKPL